MKYLKIFDKIWKLLTKIWKLLQNISKRVSKQKSENVRLSLGRTQHSKIFEIFKVFEILKNIWKLFKNIWKRASTRIPGCPLGEHNIVGDWQRQCLTIHRLVSPTSRRCIEYTNSNWNSRKLDVVAHYKHPRGICCHELQDDVIEPIERSFPVFIKGTFLS